MPILKSKCKRLRGFTVDWVSELPDDGYGGADFDRATHVYRDFDQLHEAKRYAAEVAPKDRLGSVAIDEFVMRELYNHPEIMERTYIGETLYIDRQ